MSPAELRMVLMSQESPRSIVLASRSPRRLQLATAEGWRVRVVVPPAAGEALEDALRQAAGAVVAGLDAGKAVGLELGGEQIPPRAGPRWRRLLLERLGGYGLVEGA